MTLQTRISKSSIQVIIDQFHSGKGAENRYTVKKSRRVPILHQSGRYCSEKGTAETKDEYFLNFLCRIQREEKKRMKTPEEILKNLNEYNEDERFYQSAWLARKNPDDLKAFLSSYTEEELLSRKLIVPEVEGGWYPKDMKEQCFELSQVQQKINVLKHNRYTPEFVHCHTFYELVYVLNGHCREVIAGQTFTMKTGDFLLIPPGVSHSIGVFDGSLVLNTIVWKKHFDEICHKLLLTENELSDFLKYTLNHREDAYILIHTEADAGIARLMLEMYSSSEMMSGEFSDLMMNAQLLYVFSRIIQEYPKGIHCYYSARNSEDPGEKMLEQISLLYRTITLQQLAETSGFSSKYVSRLIKKKTGRSFTALVLEKKFTTALALLDSTNLPIHELADRSGFENVEHFNRLFKKRYGMTPGQYRKRNASSQS